MPAQCLDVRRESIAPTDRFLLDTNVVLDVFGPFPGAPSERARAYQWFARRAVDVGAVACVSTVSFFEAASQIEQRLVRSRLGREPSRDEVKAARAVPELRREFVATLTQFWDDVAAIATILGAELPVDVPARSLALLARSRLDGYDPLLVHEARRHRISTIVTHDADFATVDGLIVFTANDRMLQA